MTDDGAMSAEDTQITFNVKAANDEKHVLTLPSTTTVADLKAKLSTSEYADLPPERQRLIYSGRVLKDHDTLSGVKIKDGHTVHLVKSAASNARQNPANQGTGSNPAAGGVPTNIAAGTGNNTLADLTGARYAGFHGLPSADMFGADGGMGPPPNPDQLLQMMEDPNFLQQMNEAMNNPAVIEMMQQNPMARNNPMILEMLRNPEMRRLMFNPEVVRMQLEMQRASNASRGGSSFPMPGATNTTPQDYTNTQNQPATGAAHQNPLAAMLGAGGANPFASLFGPNAGSLFAPQNQAAAGRGANDSTGAVPNAEGTHNTSSIPPTADSFASLFGTLPTAGGGQQQANPIAEAARQLALNPDAMRAAVQMLGNTNGANPFAAFGQPPPNATGTMSPPLTNPFAALFGPSNTGFGAPPPQDSRPPEEVYEVQLRQLNEMGFYEFERNIAALRRCGGNVQGAIEFLLNGGS